MPDPNTELDFWKLVDKTDTCWLWLGPECKANDTRGAIYLWQAFGKQATAHRWAWFFVHGDWPGRSLYRTCQSPTCVRPDHCRTGKKVTIEQIDEMRQLARDGLSQKAIGARYGITQAAVSYVLAPRRNA